MSEQEKKKGIHQKWIIFTIAVVVVLALVGGIVTFARKSIGTGIPQNVEPDGKRSVLLTEDNVGEILDELEESDKNQQNVPGYYTATMTNVWHFATGKDISQDAYVSNVKQNTNDVYFDVFIEGDEENPIYQSPVIPLGGELKEFSLDRPLEDGTYDCIVIYHLIDEEQNTLSYLRMAITIVVGEAD